MATELMERTVIKYLQDNSLPYSVSDGVVEVGFEDGSAGVIRVFIGDLESSPALLAFIVKDIAKFPDGRKPYAATMCNELNQYAVGKFFVERNGGVLYSFDLPAPDDARPEHVGLALDIALATVNGFHPAIMKALWANAEIEDLLAGDGEGRSAE